MESTQQQDQQSQPTTVRPRLERLRSGRAIAGVAAGLARYLGIDVAWVRIGFVVSALFGGMGLLLYLIGWLAIPEEGATDSIAVDRTGNFQNAGSWIGIGLIALAAMIVIGNTGLIAGELMFAAILIVAGVLLYRGDIGGSKPSRPSVEFVSDDGVPTEPTQPTGDAGAEPSGDAVADTIAATATRYVSPPAPPTPPLPPDPAFQPRPVKPRESSALGRFAMATLLIVLGVMGIGHSAGWFDLNLRHYAAAVFIVIGGALLVSSLFGRARWLIILGIALSPILLGMGLLKVPFEGGFGDPRHTPTNVAELNDEYRLIAGQMVLDLTSLEQTADEVLEVDASEVFGRLEVIVPADLGVDFQHLVGSQLQ